MFDGELDDEELLLVQDYLDEVEVEDATLAGYKDWLVVVGESDADEMTEEEFAAYVRAATE